MKNHPRPCKNSEQPCTQEHEYQCKPCGRAFKVSEATFYDNGRFSQVLVSPFWPACSLTCYSQLRVLDPNYLYGDDGDIPSALQEAMNMLDEMNQDATEEA